MGVDSTIVPPTPDQVTVVAAHLEAGNFLEVAALAAGLDAANLPSKIKKHFERSIAHGELTFVQRISDAGLDPKFWTANAWLLERKWPERWAKKHEDVGDRITVNVGVRVDGAGRLLEGTEVLREVKALPPRATHVNRTGRTPAEVSESRRQAARARWERKKASPPCSS